MYTNNPRYLTVFKQARSTQFEQSYLLDKNLVLCIIACLKHINLLLNLLGDELHGLFGAEARDGIFMYARSAAGTHAEALYVDLTTSEYGRNLIENAGKVFGIGHDGI